MSVTIIEFPDWLKVRVKARLVATEGTKRIVWVERTTTGDWLVHANRFLEAERRMYRAEIAGHFWCGASEVLK